jgi:hypothetical protein
VKLYLPSNPGSTGLAIENREPHLQAMGRHQGTLHGGVFAIKTMLGRLGFAQAINGAVSLFKARRGYAESDHVLNIALNPLCGGQTLEDIELRRRDEAFLKGLDAQTIPDPTTAGDFCRRFDEATIFKLMDATNELRVHVWKQQPQDFFDLARIDADGVFLPTGAQCAQGVDWSGHKGDWGYHPLVVSLANTQEPLFIVNRSGARPSHEGAAEIFDRAIVLCLKGGFRRVMLRGDTDFSQTTFLDAWDNAGNVDFVFGMDASKKLVGIAQSLEEDAWVPLARTQRIVDEDDERAKQERHRDAMVLKRGFRTLKLESEDIAEFPYRPGACNREYRLVVVRKNVHVTQGQETLFPETRYFFYISNLENVSAREIVREANQRCNQENLHSHLKSGVHALRAPLKDLVSNWAYMVMTSLAWTFKAWFSMLMPISIEKSDSDRAVSRRVLTMEFRTFVNNLMSVPVLVIETGRQVILRLLTVTPWTPHLLRTAADFRQ